MVKTVFMIIAMVYICMLIIYSLATAIAVGISGIIIHHHRDQRTLKNRLNEKNYLPVSIVLPVYNVEDSVVAQVKSLAKLKYSIYELVIVDDGSEDNTTPVLVKNLKLHQVKRPIRRVIPCKREIDVYEGKLGNVDVTLIRKYTGETINDAINMGINASKYPYFLYLSNEVSLKEDALEEMASAILQHENVIAVGGSTKISEEVVKEHRLPSSVVSALQIIKYDRAVEPSKVILSNLKSSISISEYFGLYHKNTVIESGGFDSLGTNENFSEVSKLIRHCKNKKMKFNIIYVPNAICYKAGIKTFKEMRNEKIAKIQGIKSNFRKNFKVLFNPKYSIKTNFMVIVMSLFELLAPFIEVIGLAGLVASVVFGTLEWYLALIFLGIYMTLVIYSSSSSYASNVKMVEGKMRFKEFVKISFVCIYETLIIHFCLLLFRFVGIFKPNKKSSLA